MLRRCPIGSPTRSGMPTSTSAIFNAWSCWARGGGTLWDSIQADGFSSDHLFDDYSRRIVEELIEALDGPAYEVIYPSDVLMPLGRMAQHSGWGESSPLGLTINDEYGPWLAHRMVFLVDAPLELSQRSTTHPCTTCSDTPCVTACPVGAVTVETGFDVDACSQYRIADGSPCAHKCLARLACRSAPSSPTATSR